MNLQNINVGTVPNDGTGDPLRTAFQKVNANNALLAAIPQSNITTTNPGAANDNTQGYSAGSQWLNTTTMQLWICETATTGAALWSKNGIADHPGYIAGNWYARTPGRIAASANIGTTRIFLQPFMATETFTISSLGIRITTAGTTTCQMAIYASNPATNRPTGLPLATTGALATTSAGTLAGALGSSVQVQAGTLYYFAIMVGDTSVIISSQDSADQYGVWVMGSATLANVVTINGTTVGLFCAATYGTWPDTTSATLTDNPSNTNAEMAFLVASVP